MQKETSRSVRPGRQGMVGPCISWMAATPARVQRSEYVIQGNFSVGGLVIGGGKREGRRGFGKGV